MNLKYILIVLGVLGILISLVWGITQDQVFEPWTAVIGALFAFTGLFIRSTGEEKKRIKQINLFGFFNKSKAKKFKGTLNQKNIFSFGNQQEVDDKD